MTKICLCSTSTATSDNDPTTDIYLEEVEDVIGHIFSGAQDMGQERQMKRQGQEEEEKLLKGEFNYHFGKVNNSPRKKHMVTIKCKTAVNLT